MVINISIHPYYITEMKQKLDILQIIGETVNLKRKGNRYWGLCPFHKEKTPSFTVDPKKQTYRCFGCGAHGDVIDFVMNLYSLTFNDARQWLASKYGLDACIDNQRINAKAQAEYQHRQHEAQGEDYLQNLINREYARLCAIERLIHRIINGIETETDLDKPAVIWALTQKERISHYLDIFLDGPPDEQLAITLFVRGAAI